MTSPHVPSPSDPDARVLYLTREGCHLCDDALPVVRAEADRAGTAVEVRDIDADERLREAGVLCALDDFGTGYSSLSYLKRLPLDKLKIDRSFISEVEHSTQDAAITRAIIAMVHSLERRVVAEGVETQAQMDFLKANLCDEIQGYLLSPPVPAEQFAELLR